MLSPAKYITPPPHAESVPRSQAQDSLRFFAGEETPLPCWRCPQGPASPDGHVPAGRLSVTVCAYRLRGGTRLFAAEREKAPRHPSPKPSLPQRAFPGETSETRDAPPSTKSGECTGRLFYLSKLFVISMPIRPSGAVAPEDRPSQSPHRHPFPRMAFPEALRTLRPRHAAGRAP